MGVGGGVRCTPVLHENEPKKMGARSEVNTHYYI
jgi:hypothetical protein